MRPGKPDGISDEMWAHFNQFLDQHCVGGNWERLWSAYYAGYDFRCLENQGALA